MRYFFSEMIPTILLTICVIVLWYLICLAIPAEKWQKDRWTKAEMIQIIKEVNQGDYE